MTDGSSYQPPALQLSAVTKTYGVEPHLVTALDHISLSLVRGTFTAVMGPSGSGKSTFLNCAAGLERPDSGTVLVDGEELAGRSEGALTKFRRKRIGFVFQSFNLLPYLDVQQNVTLPLRLAGLRVDHQRTREVIDQVGLGDRVDHRPAELSGGQQQRVAIARALVARPAVVFADEPTGALDSASAREVLGLLRSAVDEHDQTVVMVTHDPVAASYADSVIFLVDGRAVGQMHNPTAEAVAGQMTHLGDATALVGA